MQNRASICKFQNRCWELRKPRSLHAERRTCGSHNDFRRKKLRKVFPPHSRPAYPAADRERSKNANPSRRIWHRHRQAPGL